MIVYVAGRGQGKTNALVRWFLEQPHERGVIVANKAMRNHFLHMLYRLTGFSRVTFRRYEDNIVTASQLFGRANLRYRFREVGIDDAEQVIKELMGINIDFMAMNATLLDFRYTRQEEQTDYIDGEVIPDYDDPGYGYAKAIESRFSTRRTSIDRDRFS